MSRFLLKRTLELIPVLILVSIFSFLIVYLAPGDPMNMYIRPDMTQQEIDELRVELGLDGGPAQQYLRWLGNILRGEMGYSLINHQPVARQIAEKLPATFLLMGTSFGLSLLLSIPLGLWAGMKKNKLTDKLISLGAYLGISMPSFWLAIMLIVVFSRQLGLLPSMGMRTTGVNSVADVAAHLVLPAAVLAIGRAATFIKYIRSGTITQLEEEYVLTARAKGVSPRRVLKDHVLKNTLLPVITLAGMQLSNLVVGSFIVESVFGWPGMGTLGMSAINTRDYPLIMGFTMLSCLILIIGNLLADLLYGAVDPRIKQGRKKHA